MKDLTKRTCGSKAARRDWRNKSRCFLAIPSRIVTGAIVFSAFAGLLLAAGPGRAAPTTASSNAATESNQCRQLGTLVPGQIRVAIESFMPIIGEAGGRLTGLDGQNMTLLAHELGCQVKIVLADAAGDLAAVQAHRVDATIGSWGWSAARERAGLFTDPLYYQPVVMAQRKGTDISRVSQFPGHTLCTLTGFVFIPAMNQVPHAIVRTYPTIAAMLLDIAYGRCDIGFGNPLVIPYAESHNPVLKHLTYRYLAQPTASELKSAPLFGPVAAGYEDAIYLAPGEKKLEAALNPLIDRLVGSGREAKLLEHWGVKDPRFWLTPRDGLVNERIGVDRPTGWVAPHCSGSACR